MKLETASDRGRGASEETGCLKLAWKPTNAANLKDDANIGSNATFPLGKVASEGESLINVQQ